MEKEREKLCIGSERQGEGQSEINTSAIYLQELAT
jgi:hypothetical protein